MSSYPNIKKLSEARFNALTFTREPLASYISEELEWYTDNDEIVIGTVLHDLIDNDFAYVTLGRDEQSLFRCIELNHSINNIDEARQMLLNSININTISGNHTFPQGDIKKRKNLIFKPIVPEDNLNTNFKHLLSSIGFSPAKEIIREIAYSYIDLDGNFIQQFQTTGFNPRLWELYLYAFLHEQLCYISEDNSTPDYICTKNGIDFCMEAVTVNPTQSGDTSSADSDVNKENKDLNYYSIKYGSPLYSKLKEKYWELEHVKDKPLIFAIQDFHEDKLIRDTSSVLSTYLYGHDAKWYHDASGNLILSYVKIDEHKWQDKEIPSGFFYQPETEHISGILFSNSATPNKFNRIGKSAGFGDARVKILITGTCYNPNPQASTPLAFKQWVEEDKYFEYWSQGLELFHNPNALHPIKQELFPEIAHHIFEDGKIRSYIPDFHPMQSVTHNIVVGK